MKNSTARLLLVGLTEHLQSPKGSLSYANPLKLRSLIESNALGALMREEGLRELAAAVIAQDLADKTLEAIGKDYSTQDAIDELSILLEFITVEMQARFDEEAFSLLMIVVQLAKAGRNYSSELRALKYALRRSPVAMNLARSMVQDVSQKHLRDRMFKVPTTGAN